MQKKKNNHTKLLLIFWGIFVFFLLAIFFFFALIKWGVIGYLPPIEELQNPKNKEASEIYSSDLVLLGSYFNEKENRVSVDYSDLSPYLVEALVSTEDIRYKDHSGIDGMALIRVLFKTVILQQKSSGGGSTISQQVAKMLYSEPSKTFLTRVSKKPNEWVIAVELERLYTKEEIIAMYFNLFDFLNNAVGIRMAAHVYFDKDPKDLSIEEAALLVGMCQNPSLYNPRRTEPDRINRTTTRRNVVLDQMRKAGHLTQAQYDSIKVIPIKLKYNKVDHKAGLATYFREYLRKTMTVQRPIRENYGNLQSFKEDSAQWATNPLYGWCNKNPKAINGKDTVFYDLYRDGLKIYTTIDSRMQQYAEEAVTEHLANNLQPAFFKEKTGKAYAPFSRMLKQDKVDEILQTTMRRSDRYRKMKKSGYSEAQIDSAFHTKTPMTVFSWKNPSLDTTMTPMDSIRYLKYFLRCGFMSMDPFSGHVKAYVGGPNYNYFQYDMVTEGRRQVGSTIKPFLYTLAMIQGLTPCTEVKNVRQTLIADDGKPWTPKNDSKDKVGEMVSIRWGLATSNNNITAYLMSQFRPQVFVDLLKSFGVTGFLDPVVSIALGPVDISVEEMVSAYTAFANKGLRVGPVYVQRIEDSKGNIISNFSTEKNVVFNEETAYKMLDMLSTVSRSGTATRLRYRYQLKGPIGAKTGTTQNHSDGWFMGFTPQLVSGCWVGGEERNIHFDNMTEGQGAQMALPIWALYMQKVYANKDLGYSDEKQFDIPKDFNPCEGSEETTPPEEDPFFGGTYE